MFERFSKEARAAVIEAQSVARAAGSRSIDTRHVLVALAEGDGPAPRALRAVAVDPGALAATVRDDIRAGGLDREALAALGIDLGAVQERTDAVFGEGALERATRKGRKGHIPFTPDAKKALELSLREVIRLGHKTIDGGHLLLGIVRDADSPGSRAVRDALDVAGSDVDRLRAAVAHPEAA
jgi:ATP-dependent Clp protease ATP-binding subunit ClpA